MWFLTEAVAGYEKLEDKKVSILVLVECGFLHTNKSIVYSTYCYVSILVLVECGFLQYIRKIEVTINKEFQSLF